MSDTMEINQLAPQTPPPRAAPCYLPIRIAYVHAVGVDVNDPFVPKFRDFCHEQKVHFTTREYAPRKYSEDCDFIERLPAIQLYERGYVHKTFYPNTRPTQIVEEEVERYQKRMRAKQASKRLWNRRFTELKQSVTSLFYTKTRMEQVEEEIPVGKIVYPPEPKRTVPSKPKLLSS